MVEIKRLYDLQEMDWSLAGLESALAEVREKLADDSGIVALRDRIDQAAAKLKSVDAARKTAEREVSGLEERLKSIESKLYGGAVVNLRELTALEEERNHTQTQLGAEQDRLLELMVQIDELNATQEKGDEELRCVESEREVSLGELRGEERRLTAEIDALRKDRDATLPEFPARVLSVYETLLKSRGGQAVAKVETARGMCQACRISLPVSVLQQARSSKEIVQCNSCRRILYVV